MVSVWKVAVGGAVALVSVEKTAGLRLRPTYRELRRYWDAEVQMIGGSILHIYPEFEPAYYDARIPRGRRRTSKVQTEKYHAENPGPDRLAPRKDDGGTGSGGAAAGSLGKDTLRPPQTAPQPTTSAYTDKPNTDAVPMGHASSTPLGDTALPTAPQPADPHPVAGAAVDSPPAAAAAPPATTDSSGSSNSKGSPRGPPTPSPTDLYDETPKADDWPFQYS